MIGTLGKMVKMYNFKSEYLMLKDEIDSKLNDVLNDSAFSSGKYVEAFEKDFSNYSGSKYCVAVNNGTSALQAALMALGVGFGDEVIVPTFSFFATSEAVSLVGAKPVFVDSNDKDFNINVDDIEKNITNKTKAIICVHLFGQICEIDKLIQISTKHNLFIIEDSAQSHGAEFNNKKSGTFGDVACFSFYPTKNLGSYGEGGALLTDNEEIFSKLCMIRNHGSNKQYQHEMIGNNFRMTGFQGGILSVKLNYLDKWNGLRIKHAKLYHKLLENIDEIILPSTKKNFKHVFHQYTIRLKKRGELKEYLSINNIDSAIYYPKPCHLQKPYASQKVDCLKSEELSKEVISLPISTHIVEDDIINVCDKIKNFFHKEKT